MYIDYLITKKVKKKNRKVGYGDIRQSKVLDHKYIKRGFTKLFNTSTFTD